MPPESLRDSEYVDSSILHSLCSLKRVDCLQKHNYQEEKCRKEVRHGSAAVIACADYY